MYRGEGGRGGETRVQARDGDGDLKSGSKERMSYVGNRRRKGALRARAVRAFKFISTMILVVPYSCLFIAMPLIYQSWSNIT